MVFPGKARPLCNREEPRLTMFFSRISLPPTNARAVAPALCDDVYGLHKIVWSFLADSPDRKRDFLYRHEAQKFPCFYVVSTRAPVDSSGLWKIETKPYDPRISEGDVFRFTVRVNPVVTRRDEQGRHKRHDVVMDGKKSLKAAGKERPEWPPPGEMWQGAVAAWLRNRCAKHGFDFTDTDIRVDGYMPTRIYDRKHSAPVQIATVDIHGRLTVADPTAFRKMLFEGLGPAKGFGCGLMLVRRAGM